MKAAGGASRRPEVMALVGIVVLVGVFFWRALALQGFLIHSDICYFFEPAKAFMHEALRAGRLPLWSPYIFCGYPIAAEGQIAAFYPPSILVSWLLPSAAAINWLIVLHLALGGLSLYALARRLGITPFGAWLSGFVFSFSGYLFAHLHHISLICAAAWLPVVLLFVDRAWSRNLAVNGAFAGLAWGASCLCGHPQTVFHISLGVVFWIVWRASQSSVKDRRTALCRGVALTGMVFVLGAGIGAVQLLLTAELSALAPHGDVGTLEYVTSFSLLPYHLLGLIAPNWQGTIAFNTYRGERYYWEYVLYIGLVPLLLALIGASTRRGRVFAGVATVALILALAKGNPLYHALRLLPGFSDFRVPARYVFLFTFATAILAGYGWDAVAAARLFAGRRRAAAVAGVVAALTVADLFWFDRTLAPLASRQVVEATPRVVEVLKQDPTWGRVFVVPPIALFADWSPPGGWAANPDGWIEARVYLPASVPQSFGLRAVGGYAGFVDSRQAPFFQDASQEAFQEGRAELLSLVGTRYFVIGPGPGVRGLPAVDIPPFRVYQNFASFPRAFTVGSIIAASNHVEALSRTLELGRARRLEDVGVTSGSVGDLDLGRAKGTVLAVDELRPEHIAVRARSVGDTLVVLNERWDPGWRARVDGRAAPLLEVDSVLMGAPMPAGEHQVEFLYQPRGLLVGRVISLASLVILVLVLATASLAGRRKGSS